MSLHCHVPRINQRQKKTVPALSHEGKHTVELIIIIINPDSTYNISAEDCLYRYYI